MALLMGARPAGAQLALDANTIALWHFDDAPGLVAVDSGPQQHDLALLRHPQDGSGGTEFPVFTPDGCVGGALLFQPSSTSTGGYAFDDGPVPLAGNAFTVELFLRTTASEYGDILHDGNLHLDFYLGWEGGVGFETGDGVNWSPLLDGSSTVNDGQWHYVAATYDGATMRIYVDGVDDGSVAYDGTIGSFSAYHLGGRPSNTFFDGTLDEVRISNVARSAGEIASTASAITCPEPGSDAAGSAAAAALVLAAARRRRPGPLRSPR